MFDSKNDAFNQDEFNREINNALINDNAAVLMEKFKELQLKKTSDAAKTNTLLALLKKCIQERAFKCVNILLPELNQPALDELIQNTADQGDALMTLALEKYNFAAAANRLFKNKDMPIFFKTLFRFAPFDIVDQLVKSYLKNKSNEDLFLKTYETAKREYFKEAPYFSRYSKSSHLNQVKDVYQNISDLELSKVCKKDLEYGIARYNLANELAAKLSPDAKKNFHPTRLDILALPPSSNGTRRAAAILEKISDFTFSNFANEGLKIQFAKLRKKYLAFTTSMDGRYCFALPLAKAVSKFSNAPDIIKCEAEQKYALVYPLDARTSYCLNDVWKSSWHHGNAPLAMTWKKIEDLFEKIVGMTLNDGKKETLTEFYSLTAELVWLIGNTQPMHRGSGSFAEMMLAIVHLHHNLQPPILKLEFPQLDVLDITFPLSDYKFFFPYFFEPSTMPEHLRFKDISSSDSIEQQMEQLYQRRNMLSQPDEKSKISSTPNPTVIKIQEVIQSIKKACEKLYGSPSIIPELDYFFQKSNMLRILEGIVREDGHITQEKIEYLESLMNSYPSEYNLMPGYDCFSQEAKSELCHKLTVAVDEVRKLLPNTKFKSTDKSVSVRHSNLFVDRKEPALDLPEPESSILSLIKSLAEKRDQIIAAVENEEIMLSNSTPTEENSAKLKNCELIRKGISNQHDEISYYLRDLNQYEGYNMWKAMFDTIDWALDKLVRIASDACKPLILNYKNKMQEANQDFSELQSITFSEKSPNSNTRP